jgi:2',3'-cyclic-nucleotide 2'-phosphodiesterase (5'-nucleotidase family)
VIEKLAKKARFPMVSANTYLKASLKTVTGDRVSVASQGCQPLATPSTPIDWSVAQQPQFLKPYTIVKKAGVRIALIGIDNSGTAQITTQANVSDLCFADEVETYKRVRESIKDQADVFVLMIHQGDAKVPGELTKIVNKLTSGSTPLVDAVISGHTHFTTQSRFKGGIFAIQSGAEGEAFGRIDLYFNSETKKIEHQKSMSIAGAELFHEACDSHAYFCKIDTSGDLKYETIKVTISSAIDTLVANVRKEISGLADTILTTSDGDLKKSRTDENALGNALSDTMRSLTKTDFAFINSGGIRTEITGTSVTYEKLFDVLPMNNHGVIMKSVQWSTLKKLLSLSIQSCGVRGALNISGMKITFKRNCKTALNQEDKNAELVSVTKSDGTVLFKNDGTEIDPETAFSVTTIDFLANGGSGYAAFSEAKIDQDFGILREKMVDYLKANHTPWTSKIDNRYLELAQ